MNPELDLLFRSKGFILCVERARLPEPLGCGEDLVWVDRTGPLTISRLHGEAMTYRLRLGGDISVDLSPDNLLSVRSLATVPDCAVEHFLADQVLPRAIARSGELVLHSAAVSADDGAILLLGASGSGKSTLSASFHSAGLQMMGDDAVLVDLADGGAAGASAVYASLRLFPDSIDALLGGFAAGQGIGDHTDKLKVAIPGDRPQSPSTLPVAAIFRLEDSPDAGIHVRPLSIADACMALVKNSFALDPTDSGQAALRLASASRLAKAVPAFAISYPRDYGRLPEVRDSILQASTIRSGESVAA